jgi:uncharacterized protein involved in exopolysaccharide biosynthesis
MTMERKVFGTPAVPLEQGADADQGDFGGGFDLAALLQMLRVRQKIIAGTAAVVVAITAVVVFHMTPLYDAGALVMLDQRQNKVMDVDAVLSGLPTDATSIENQLEILKSRSLMSHVIDKLHLDRALPAQAASPGVVSSAIYYVNPLH